MRLCHKFQLNAAPMSQSTDSEYYIFFASCVLNVKGFGNKVTVGCQRESISSVARAVGSNWAPHVTSNLSSLFLKIVCELFPVWPILWNSAPRCLATSDNWYGSIVTMFVSFRVSLCYYSNSSYARGHIYMMLCNSQSLAQALCN